MASRKEQKEAARRAREQAHAQLKASQQRRTRMIALAGVLVVVIAAAVVVIIASSGGGGSLKGLNPSKLSSQKVDGAAFSPKTGVAEVKSLLDGIPENGNVLGDPSAPVTITEYGDLVCSTCDAWVTIGSEDQLISQYVRTGKVKLVYRASETASSFANGSEFLTSQVAARAAGLQGKAWYYIQLVYDEQPRTINGQSSEEVAYVNTAYLQNRAQQVPGLKLGTWQANLTNPTLVNAVKADVTAANTQAPHGTPTIIVSGPKGSVTYDANQQQPSVLPTIQQLAQLISQVS